MCSLLLHIDHMNDTATYLKKLRGWIDELSLHGKLLYRLRTTPCNASSGGSKVVPKARAENIVLLLEGAHVSEFMKRLRTAKLTSQDRREKKSSVIWESGQVSSSIWKPVFPLGLELVQYRDWAELSRLWDSLGLEAQGGPSFQESFGLKEGVAGEARGSE